MSRKVGSKGQVVIDAEIRRKLGIEPGWTTHQVLVGDHVEIRFIPPRHSRSLKGCLAKHIQRRMEPEDWDRVREEAWEKAVREDWLAQE